VVSFVVLHSGEIDDATGVIGLHTDCIRMGDGRWVSLDYVLQVLKVWVIWDYIIRI